MSSIEPRKDKNQKITGYRAKVRVKGYPPQTATFKKKTDANEWAQRVESEIKQGKYFPHRSAKKNTVPVLIEKYLAHLQAVNSRRYEEVKPLLKWWQAEFKDKPLASLSAEDILNSRQKLLNRKKQRKGADGEYHTLSPATVNRYMTALHTALQFGIKPLKWIMTG